MKKIVKVGTIIALMVIGLAYILIGKNQIVDMNINDTASKTYKNANYYKYVDVTNIVKDKSGLKGVYKLFYDKYISYTAPNGKKIYIVANKDVTDEQLLKSYNVLEMYLKSNNSYDMEKVTNRIADSGAVIIMPDGADGESKTPFFALLGQPLYYSEVPTEGSKWYIENDYKHRDAAYEEILHFVHDNGIGTKSNPGALPELQKKIYDATVNALPKEKEKWTKEGLWAVDNSGNEGNRTKEWLLSLEKEGSLEQEYLASVVDSYYGLWAPYEEAEGGMWGMYIAKDRSGIAEKDPKGYEVVTDFLPPTLTYMGRIDASFEGDFKMYLDKNEPYTHKSQYLINARLLGNKASNLFANDNDNILMGNEGNNIIDGKNGIDVVQFSGAFSEYEIKSEGDSLMVKDLKDRDGIDKLINIEILRFTDKDILN